MTYLRPADLARPHGISPQSVRNYENDGVIPPAARSESGYRRYTSVHVTALAAYLALVRAHGYAVAGDIMRAVGAGNLEAAFRAVDDSHALLLRDRSTLDEVALACADLVVPQVVAGDRPVSIGVLAHRLRLKPATLRKWERAGILQPSRVLGHRVYTAADVRDADLAHLLRRGGYLLGHIAGVVAQVRAAGGAESLAQSLDTWRERLSRRARLMLTAAARLDEHLESVDL